MSYQFPGQFRLVPVGEGRLHGQDDAVGDDGDEDGVLEGRPLDQEHDEPPDKVGLAQDEQGRRAFRLLVLFLLLRPDRLKKHR